jgi:hypothetical protein
MANTESMSGARKAEIGAGIAAGVAAAALGAYFLYGSKDAKKNRAKVKGWMLKARGEVLEQLENHGAGYRIFLRCCCKKRTSELPRVEKCERGGTRSARERSSAALEDAEADVQGGKIDRPSEGRTHPLFEGRQRAQARPAPVVFEAINKKPALGERVFCRG